jgi:monoamine oxidase
LGAAAGPVGRALAVPRPPSGDVAIVGSGLAGLACGDELRRFGVRATILRGERARGRPVLLAGRRVSGPRRLSRPGDRARGAFIDTAPKTMIGYEKRFGLDLEEVTKGKEDVFYHFFGQRHVEGEVVDEFRVLVDAVRTDLRALRTPTADSFTPKDAVLDFTNLQEYLETRGAEYGLEIDRQSCINFPLFVHADRRSKFTPFGVFSDERYHVIGGNQQIPAGLAAGLAGQIRFGLTLLGVSKTPAGRIELMLQDGSSTVTRTHDAVVIAIPFSVLRDVTLAASLGLPPSKLFAIQNLQYGTNAKMMIGFAGPMWRGLGSNGQSYSDLPNHQSTWETNPSRATRAHAVLTDYSGGDRGDGLDPDAVQLEASRFLVDLDKVYPGALAAAKRDAGASPRAPRALAVQSADEWLVHVQPARVFHDDRRQ